MKSILYFFSCMIFISLIVTNCKTQEKKDASENTDTNKQKMIAQNQSQNLPLPDADVQNKTINTTGEQVASQTEAKDSVFPDWVKKLYITLPEGLKFQPRTSSLTSFDNPRQRYNSLTFSFKGDYNKAMEQAEIIAKKANIPISPEFQKALELQKQNKEIAKKDGHKIMMPEMKGINYSNQSTFNTGKNKPEYSINIIVEENGTLRIIIVNQKQLSNISQ
jgi:hypothetical protein